MSEEKKKNDEAVPVTEDDVTNAGCVGSGSGLLMGFVFGLWIARRIPPGTWETIEGVFSQLMQPFPDNSLFGILQFLVVMTIGIGVLVHLTAFIFRSHK